MDADGFTIVCRKPRRQSSSDSEKTVKNVTKEDIITKYSIVLKRHGACAAVLYGSRANGNNRPRSDIDIMVFWEKSSVPSDETLESIALNLKLVFNLEIDFVVMKYSPFRTRDVKHDTKCKDFMDNVAAEGIVILGDSSCIHYVYSSEKIMKIHI
jgi:predicted nucleotidyltransferase